MGNVMDRKIEVLLAGQRVIDDGDMLRYRALPSPSRKAVGPFVFVDHYRLSLPKTRVVKKQKRLRNQ
jgi:hypothetical protein